MSYSRKVLHNIRFIKHHKACANKELKKQKPIGTKANQLLAIYVVGRSGFEPLKSKDSGFTVRPIWPLWNLPY
jgi:hypothetical protein